MLILSGHTPDTASVDFPSLLDEAIRQLAARLDALVSEQKEVEMSLMGLKELRANVGHLPEPAIRALLAAMQQQAGGLVPRRVEVIDTFWGAVATDDEDGPACAEPLTAAESLTNYEKIVQFFLARKNQPATNQDIRTAIGASRGAVAQILYTSHSDKFERSSKREAGKVAWQLRAPIYRTEAGRQVPDTPKKATSAGEAAVAAYLRTRARRTAEMALKEAGKGGYTGDACPVSGIYRCECGARSELPFAQGHIFPPCEKCQRKAFWTLVRREDVRPVE
jgi:hypothetical protein